MRAVTTSIFAFAAFVAFAQAECCTPDSAFGDYCPDGADATPCCGVGSCNIFCCNCDNGCRTATYDGCIANAGHSYGPSSDCTTCEVAIFRPGCDNPDYCTNQYNGAVAACKSQYGVSKRGAGLPWADKRQQPDPGNGYEVFSLVDKDKNGNITLEEYVEYLHFSRPTLKDNPHLLVQWFEYFEKFDKNKDGVIKIDEHHRVIDD